MRVKKTGQIKYQTWLDTFGHFGKVNMPILKESMDFLAKKSIIKMSALASNPICRHDPIKVDFQEIYFDGVILF